MKIDEESVLIRVLSKRDWSQCMTEVFVSLLDRRFVRIPRHHMEML